MPGDLTRRVFLQRLFGGAAALAFMPQLEALGVGYADAPIDTPGGDAFTELTAREAWRLFLRISEARGHRFEMRDGEYAVGSTTPDGLLFRHMFGIDLRDGMRLGLEAPMTQLVDYAISEGVGAYGHLPMPVNVEAAQRAGAIRYVQTWDPISAQMMRRFDVLGATTEEGLRFSYRTKAADTKARLLAERAERFRVGMRSLPPVFPPVMFRG